jgi:SAM-dependent methyltransferase
MVTGHRARAAWTFFRAGDLRGRMRVIRDGQAAIRLHVVAAALETGLLDSLAGKPRSTADLARRVGVSDESVLDAFLRVVAASGLLAGGHGRLWRLSARGRRVVGDDLVRAGYEGFAGFHTGLYRDLRPLLAGGPRRRDVVERGAVIARISAAFEPFVVDLLVGEVAKRSPHRVLDVGCGAGLELAAVLEAAPGAEGVGVDTDADAAALAERTLAGRGLADRGRIIRADIREMLEEGDTGPFAEPFDLALLANVVYYVPVGERAELFRGLGRLLSPGGVLLVITTVATDDLFSRHFDLLLRAQEGRMELPDAGHLAEQLAEAGLRPDPPRRIPPGSPIIALTATRSSP